jgi:hypothetical protein
MEMLISLLVFVIVAGLIWWLIQQLPLPAPFGRVAQVVFIVICLVVLLGYLFGGLSLPRFR